MCRCCQPYQRKLAVRTRTNNLTDLRSATPPDSTAMSGRRSWQVRQAIPDHIGQPWCPAICRKRGAFRGLARYRSCACSAARCRAAHSPSSYAWLPARSNACRGSASTTAAPGATIWAMSRDGRSDAPAVYAALGDSISIDEYAGGSGLGGGEPVRPQPRRHLPSVARTRPDHRPPGGAPVTPAIEPASRRDERPCPAGRQPCEGVGRIENLSRRSDPADPPPGKDGRAPSLSRANRLFAHVKAG